MAFNISQDTPARPKSTHDPNFSRSTLQEMRVAVLKDVGICPVVTIETFFTELLPSLSGSPSLVVEIEQELRASGKLARSAAGGDTWPNMVRPGKSREVESRAFAPLEDIIQSIIAKVAIAKNFDPELVFQADGSNPLPNINPQGSTTMPDGVFSVPSSVERSILSNTKAGVPWWEQVLLSGEFKKKKRKEDLQDDVEKLLWNMNHVMRSDPRRRFTFGITAENTTMRIWYCSRTAVVVTQPFDYFEQSSHLIRLVASLACATETQRGFDPTMRLVQGWEQTHPMYDIDVYTDADTPPTTYRSRVLLSDFGAHALRGRATRVFEVQLLVNGEPTGDFHALKDVWVDFDRDTEGKLLEDIEASIGEEDKEAFRRHFMTKLEHGYVYVPNEEGSLVIDRAFTPTTYSVVDGVRRWSYFDLGFTKSRGPETKRSGCPLDESKPPNKSMGFSNKNHYRIVFKDVGTPVFQITSVKLMFKVLADIMTALEILHRAGWIHRDLSPSNVYAHNGDGKLSDLEYAKKHTDNSKHEVRTGTAQFMASEVERQIFLFCGAPFRANGLHDIESSLWIVIWMLFFSTASVLDEPPASGADTSGQLEAAYELVYEDRRETMLEYAAGLELGFQTLTPNVAFICPLLEDARDSVARHLKIVGKALRFGTATIQTVHSLYTSVYTSVRTVYQTISDQAPQELYLHFITKDPSPKRKERDDTSESSQTDESTEDKASQVMDEVPLAKKRRQ